jgi:hypothetical protein
MATVNAYVRLESSFLEACAPTIDRPASLVRAGNSNQMVRISACDCSIPSFDSVNGLIKQTRMCDNDMQSVWRTRSMFKSISILLFFRLLLPGYGLSISIWYFPAGLRLNLPKKKAPRIKDCWAKYTRTDRGAGARGKDAPPPTPSILFSCFD